jgi:hypothetical protein
MIDAASGQPLAGVQGTSFLDMWQPGAPGLLPVHLRHPEEQASSDATGLVQFPREGYEFELAKEGYEPAAITGTTRGFKRAKTLNLLGTTLPTEEDGTVLVSFQRLEPD